MKDKAQLFVVGGLKLMEDLGVPSRLSLGMGHLLLSR